MKKSLVLPILMFIFSISFVAAEECRGDFELSKESFQWGDEFNLIGTNLEVDQELYTGSLELEFNSEDTDSVFFYAYKGDFDFKGVFGKDEDLNGFGDYNLNVKFVKQGNVLCEIENVKEFDVSNELIMLMELQEQEYLPGETVILEGTLQRKTGGLVSNGKINIDFDGQDYSTSFSNGNFKYPLALSDTVKSNYHSINLRAEDDFGNTINSETNIFVVPQVKKIEIITDKGNYLPGDLIQISVRLYDQANDEVLDEVDIRLYDPNEERLIRDSIETSQSLEHQLDKFSSLNGEWVAKARFDDLIDETIFTVERIEGISTEIIDGVLIVRNQGNVKYTEPLVLTATGQGGTETQTKRTNINPGDEFDLDLVKEFGDGDYNLYINNTGENYQVTINDNRGFLEKIRDSFSGFTGNVVGKPGSSTSSFGSYLLLVLFLLIAVSFYLRYRVFGKKTKVTGTKRKINFSKIKDKLKPKRAKHKHRVKPFVISKKKESKEEINEFKHRILKDIENYEKTRKDEDKFYKLVKENKKEDDKNVREGLFKMFE